MDMDELANRFAYHAPSNDSVREAHEEVRNLCGAIARDLAELLPEGREKAVVMTKLEEAMFWANAAIARTQQVSPQG